MGFLRRELVVPVLLMLAARRAAVIECVPQSFEDILAPLHDGKPSPKLDTPGIMSLIPTSWLILAPAAIGAVAIMVYCTYLIFTLWAGPA